MLLGAVAFGAVQVFQKSGLISLLKSTFSSSGDRPKGASKGPNQQNRGTKKFVLFISAKKSGRYC